MSTVINNYLKRMLTQRVSKNITDESKSIDESVININYQCFSCKNSFPNIREYPPVSEVPEYIVGLLPENLAQETMKRTMNSLIFLSKAVETETFLNIELVLDVILETLFGIEAYVLGFFVDKGSVFLKSSKNQEESNFDSRKKIVHNFYYQLSRFVAHFELIRGTYIYESCLTAWNNSPCCPSIKEGLENTFDVNLLKNAILELVLLLCPSLEEREDFKKYRFDIGKCDAVQKNVLCHPKMCSNERNMAVRVMKLNNSLPRMRSIPDNMNKVCPVGYKGVPFSNSAIRKSSVTESAVPKTQLLIASSSSQESYKICGNLSDEVLRDSGIFSVSSEEGVFKNERPALMKLSYFLHSQSQSNCICHIDETTIPARHLVKGFYADIIVHICNFRVGLEKNQEIKNIYESFLTCYTIFMSGNELISKLIIRCISLFPHDFRSPSLQFKGCLYVLIDVLNSNRNFIGNKVMKHLWTLLFLLIGVGRLKWARDIRSILVKYSCTSKNDFTFCFDERKTSLSPYCANILPLCDSMREVGLEILKIPPNVLCEQITTLQEALYHDVTPCLFVAYALEKALPKDNNISKIAKNFDSVVSWIESLILSAKKAVQPKLVDYFISVAFKAILINNFMLAKIIVTCFQSIALFKLKPINERQSDLNKIASIVDCSYNYACYRKYLIKAKEAFIPVLFIHDNDIKKIHLKYSSLKNPVESRTDMNTLPNSNSSSSSDISIGNKHNSDLVKETIKPSLKKQSSYSSTDDSNWLNFEEYYEIRKYLSKYRLFQFKFHYMICQNPVIIKSLNEFVVLTNEISNNTYSTIRH